MNATGEPSGGDTPSWTALATCPIAALRSEFDLYPGDVIWMKTAKASPNLKPGDVVEIDITAIGTLRHPFTIEEQASYAAHRELLQALLSSWGMRPAFAERTAEVMSWADLHGIDSHGISMVPAYFERHKNGRIKMAAEPTVERKTPVSALLNGGGGLGHEPARQAIELAIEKARTISVGIVSVHNASQLGTCGFYAKMAADAGMVATSTSAVQVAPTGGVQARLGTDPWAFAAPGRPGKLFVLDMATTTVAAGRIRNKANENLPAPAGWLLTREGQPSTNPLEAVQHGGFLTSLGGSPEGSSHKGYGLSTMVNILGSCLSGATLITDPIHTKKP